MMIIKTLIYAETNSENVVETAWVVGLHIESSFNNSNNQYLLYDNESRAGIPIGFISRNGTIFGIELSSAGYYTNQNDLAMIPDTETTWTELLEQYNNATLYAGYSDNSIDSNTIWNYVQRRK